MMVRATSAEVKAPDVRWPQLVKPVNAAQSAFVLHATAGFRNAFVTLFLQKPQKTFA